MRPAFFELQDRPTQHQRALLDSRSRPLVEQAIQAIQVTIKEQTQNRLQALHRQLQSLHLQIQKANTDTLASLSTLNTNARMYSNTLQDLLQYGMLCQVPDQFLTAFVRVSGTVAVVDESLLSSTLSKYGYSSQSLIVPRQQQLLEQSVSTVRVGQTNISGAARFYESDGQFAKAYDIIKQQLPKLRGINREDALWHAATLALKANKKESAIQHFEECAKEAEKHQHLARAVESWVEVAALVGPANAPSINRYVEHLLSQTGSRDSAEDSELSEAISRSLRF